LVVEVLAGILLEQMEQMALIQLLVLCSLQKVVDTEPELEHLVAQIPLVVLAVMVVEVLVMLLILEQFVVVLVVVLVVCLELLLVVLLLLELMYLVVTELKGFLAEGQFNTLLKILEEAEESTALVAAVAVVQLEVLPQRLALRVEEMVVINPMAQQVPLTLAVVAVEQGRPIIPALGLVEQVVRVTAV
jgi:hypothetical protein